MQIKKFTFNPFQENTYVVYSDNKDTLIIDPGCYTEEEERKLQQFITTNNLNVRYITNTHLHIDHVLGNGFTEKVFHIKTSANAKNDSWICEIEHQATLFGLPLRYALNPLGQQIQEGNIIKLGEEVFDILETPGHSSSDIALYNAKQKCVFVGDVLFQNSIGRSDLYGGNYASLIANINQKLLTLPEDTVVYPGHGPSTTIGEEKRTNPYL